MRSIRMPALAAAVVCALVGIVAAAAAPPGYVQSQRHIAVEGRDASVARSRGRCGGACSRGSRPSSPERCRSQRCDACSTPTLGAAPIGARTGESALPLGPNRRTYVAEHRWGPRTIALQAVFDSRGVIAGIDLGPRRGSRATRAPGIGSEARLSLPIRGEWWVFWGGPTERQNYHVVAPDQRHAYDLVVWRSGGTHRGTGARQRGLLGMGAADARAGRRRRRRSGRRDSRQPAAGRGGEPGSSRRGTTSSSTSGTASTRCWRTCEGERPRAGGPARSARRRARGLSGNSGNSSEPHLHFHVQDRPALFGAARGLPVSFVELPRRRPAVARGTPVQGQFVERGRRGG